MGAILGLMVYELLALTSKENNCSATNAEINEEQQEEFLPNFSKFIEENK